MNQRAEHVPEIDWTKGFAILGVICIHAKLADDSLFFLQVLNRSVHVFLVLFGISSELWWGREEPGGAVQHGALRRWYKGRLQRILPGYWAMTLIWWLAVLLYRKPPGDLHLGPLEAVVSFTGYAPWIGTSWFVAIILQYVLVFPFLRRALVAVSAPVALLVSAAASFASCWFILQIVTAGKALLGNNVPWPGWYYQWIFAPRVLWDVTAGVFVARWWKGRISVPVMLAAIVATVLGGFLSYYARHAVADNLGPVREMAVAHLVDVPLSLALLGLFRWLPLPQVVQRFLAWCGLRSWGIYLAHLLLHELVQIAGYQPFMASQAVRAAYALALLAGGATLAVAAAWVERGVRERLAAPRVSSAA